MTNAASASEIPALVSVPHQYSEREQAQHCRMEAKRITNATFSLMPGCQRNERERHVTRTERIIDRPQCNCFRLSDPSPLARPHIDHLPKGRTICSGSIDEGCDLDLYLYRSPAKIIQIYASNEFSTIASCHHTDTFVDVALVATLFGLVTRIRPMDSESSGTHTSHTPSPICAHQLSFLGRGGE